MGPGSRAVRLPRAAPNQALEPTPAAFARTSLRLLARLTAGVRPYHSDWIPWMPLKLEPQSFRYLLRAMPQAMALVCGASVGDAPSSP